jgi:hypothetical protein
MKSKGLTPERLEKIKKIITENKEKEQIAFTNKIEGGKYCNDCASGEKLLATPIKVTNGAICDDCGGVTNG